MPRKHLTSAFIKSADTDKQIDYYDTLTPGLGIRISPGGTKTFFYKYRHKGKYRRYSFDRFRTGFGLSDARVKVGELKSQVKKGRDPHGEELDRKSGEAPKTFKEAIEAYKKKHFPKLKQSTQDDYKRRINQFYSEFGIQKLNRAVGKIKRIEIRDYLEEKAVSSPTNAQRLQAILSGIFTFAADRGWIDANIAARISFTEERKKSKKKQWQNRAFEVSEIKTLWDAFDQHAEPVGSLFKLLMILGQRAGETRLMKWQDVDFKNSLWVIPDTDTKNGETHYVPLPNLALELLETLRQWNSGTYVFESPVIEGQPVGHPQKAAQRIRNKTGVDFNIHSLRTTFATFQAALKTPAQVLSKLLNHKKPGEGSDITDLYVRYDFDAEKRRAMNLWANYLQDIISGELEKETPIHKLPA